jgi:hypothetical protein
MLEIQSDRPLGDAEIYISFDAEGLEALLRALNNSRASGHEHLMTKAWGGSELTSPSDDPHAIHKVTLSFES